LDNDSSVRYFDLVFILDEGSVFDAPVDKIWRFMQTPGEHHKHGSMTNVRREMDGNSALLSFDAEGPGGAKTLVRIKSTPLLPVGRMMEYIEGPLAGSRAFSYYVPMGDKTGVTIVGEYVSRSIPENQLKSTVMAQLEKSFNEDNENLKNFK
jgi:hypothetical protein